MSSKNNGNAKPRAKVQAKKAPKAKKKSERYGIAEWFGRDITTLTTDERRDFAQTAIRQGQEGDLSHAKDCPFLSTLVQNAKCNKASGVCSIRKFTKAEGEIGTPSDRSIVALCPLRFLQIMADDKNIFSWIAETMLDIDAPIIVKETPFLRTIHDAPNIPDTRMEVREQAAAAYAEVSAAAEPQKEATEDEGKKAGRIDWILVKPETLGSGELEWCAVETQSLYFSGGEMRPEFDAYERNPDGVLYPAKHRRPDYRSSGPKRLAPQLDVKVPVLRGWGKKIAVLVDRFFFENMNALEEADPRARDDRARRDNSEVVWFVVDFDENLRMTPYRKVFTSLDSSKKALNATEPLSKPDFTQGLRNVISNPRSNKVFGKKD